MAKVKIGNILNCIFNRGALSTIWASTAAYTKGQYVTYGNYIYKCIKNATAGTLPTNTTYFVKTDLASEITSLNSNIKNLNIKGTQELIGTLTTSSGIVVINKDISNYKYISIDIIQAYSNCVLFVPTWLLSMESSYSFSYGKPVAENGAQGIINFYFPSGENLFKIEFAEIWTKGWPFSKWEIYGII